MSQQVLADLAGLTQGVFALKALGYLDLAHSLLIR
jgi:hypothetical protein